MGDDYRQRKRFFDNLLTIYGRKPVLEVLTDTSIPVYRLHLAESNQSSGILGQIIRAAEARGIEIRYHSREALSRISRNRRQDQGVAVDVDCPGYRDYRDFLAESRHAPYRLIALDRITNPQNLGMIIRSVAASPIDGLLLPARGCAPISPLVIKASAGTLFKCGILRCENLEDALTALRADGAEVTVLSGSAAETLGSHTPAGNVVYVLGNETEGVDPAIDALADRRIRIAMHNGVESLNVAVTAALIAFRDSLHCDHADVSARQPKLQDQ